MITRTIYLKDPDSWRGTPEEKELLQECEWTINNPHFHFEFSPVMVDCLTNQQYPNINAYRTDLWFVILSKSVLEVTKNG